MEVLDTTVRHQSNYRAWNSCCCLLLVQFGRFRLLLVDGCLFGLGCESYPSLWPYILSQVPISTSTYVSGNSQLRFIEVTAAKSLLYAFCFFGIQYSFLL